MNRSPDARARRAWSLGNYSMIAPHFLPMAGQLVESARIKSEDRVLDLACGTGNVAITSARRGAAVTGLDLVPGMLEEAQRNARLAGVQVRWEEGSATRLPFPDHTFHVVLSNLGMIFAQPPELAARELLRVTRPGGRIAFTSWTPESVVAAMGRVVGRFLPPPPPDEEPPFRWGDPDVVRERLGDRLYDLEFRTGHLSVPVLSPAHYWGKAVTESGPFISALDQVTAADRKELRRDVERVVGEFFDPARNIIRQEYRLVRGMAPERPAT